MTTKKNSPVDAIAVAERCEAAAIECGEALQTLSETFKLAANSIRTMHMLLVQIECKHVMTFKVTQEMIASGLDERAAGAYCMVCGESLDRSKEKTKQENKDG